MLYHEWHLKNCSHADLTDYLCLATTNVCVLQDGMSVLGQLVKDMPTHQVGCADGVYQKWDGFLLDTAQDKITGAVEVPVHCRLPLPAPFILPMVRESGSITAGSQGYTHK